MYKSQSSNAGRLRKRIVIKTPVRTSNGQGGFNVTYKRLRETYADIELRSSGGNSSSGYRSEQAFEFVINDIYIIDVRFRNDFVFTKDMLIEYNGIDLSILSIENKGERDSLIRLKCANTV